MVYLRCSVGDPTLQGPPLDQQLDKQPKLSVALTPDFSRGGRASRHTRFVPSSGESILTISSITCKSYLTFRPYGKHCIYFCTFSPMAADGRDRMRGHRAWNFLNLASSRFLSRARSLRSALVIEVLLLNIPTRLRKYSLVTGWRIISWPRSRKQILVPRLIPYLRRSSAGITI